MNRNGSLVHPFEPAALPQDIKKGGDWEAKFLAGLVLVGEASFLRKRSRSSQRVLCRQKAPTPILSPSMKAKQLVQVMQDESARTTRMVPFEHFLKSHCISRQTGYAWLRKGYIRCAGNIGKKKFICLDSLKEFAERARAGEFQIDNHVPVKTKH